MEAVLDEPFGGLAFHDAQRAAQNLARVHARLTEALWARLPVLLGQVPDPDGALNFLERYLAAASKSLVAYLDRHPVSFHHLLLIFSHSRFLSETLVQQPELIRWLHRSAGRSGQSHLEQLKRPEEFREELARFRTVHFDWPLGVILAQFKRREYLRIMLRDCAGLATLAETTLELSHLADALLQVALQACLQELERRYGIPQFATAEERLHRSRCVLLALGKLGGQELNYSSDIDLMFLYEADGQTSGGERGSIANAEFFARAVSSFLKVIAYPGPVGAVFRTDLRLRPEGSLGDAAISLPAALHYYQRRARQWELQMLLKARPAAGDLELGEDFLQQVWPLLFAAVTHPPTLQDAIRPESPRQNRFRKETEAINVKLCPGGIRDIEFLVQYLRRLYGSRDSWLAVRAPQSTLLTLQRLHDKGYLSTFDFHRLTTAYQLLRHVEHRLQLHEGLQTHTLPTDPAELDLLARRAGFSAAASGEAGRQLVARLEQHLREVRGIIQRVLDQSAQLTARGDEAASASPRTWDPLSQLAKNYPALARAVVAAGWEDQAAVRAGLSRLFASALTDAALMAQLEARAAELPRVALLVAQSQLLANWLAQRPVDVLLAAKPELAAVEAELAALTQPNQPAEVLADRMRVVSRRVAVVLAARSILGVAGPFETFRRWSHLADRLLERLLEAILAELVPTDTLATAPFVVLALGRLGSCELDFGSDVDLVFVADTPEQERDGERWRRLAERFVQLIGLYTRHGLLYRVDARLRPRGTEGEIVQSSAYLRQYFEKAAAGWEALSFYKARPVAGNRIFGEKTLEVLRAVIRARFGTGPGANLLAQSLVQLHARLEQQWRLRGRPRNLKLLPGGYHDLEYLLGYLAVGAGVPLHERDLCAQVTALAAAGWLDAPTEKLLRQAAHLYRSVDHAVRLVCAGPSDLPSEPAKAARIEALLRQWGFADAHRWASVVEQCCRQVAEAFASVVQAGTPGSPPSPLARPEALHTDSSVDSRRANP